MALKTDRLAECQQITALARHSARVAATGALLRHPAASWQGRGRTPHALRRIGCRDDHLHSKRALDRAPARV
ncbi:MAG: hypothetical protein ABS59_16610 [Methylobacterium sp. SCN 67-24]|jgi:SRSO17 transposase|nr:MAG: hypothetical protein ABS59_16610 [Methylobacterium sp. SCN 67-24]